MWHRKHTYMRLDGSSKISDRRDMVADFQSRSDIFVFLLSTRAGGLGINLTAADTVSQSFVKNFHVFYIKKRALVYLVELKRNVMWCLPTIHEINIHVLLRTCKACLKVNVYFTFSKISYTWRKLYRYTSHWFPWKQAIMSLQKFYSFFFSILIIID